MELFGPGPMSPIARRRFGDFIGIPFKAVTLAYHPPHKALTDLYLAVHAGLSPEELGELDPALLEAELDDDARARLGAIHPMLMGGEYLPSFRQGEVEIARIALASVTGDVFSIRARRRPSGVFVYSMDLPEKFVC